MGETGSSQEIGRAVHRVHVLVDHAPHVAALSAEDPFDPKPLCLGVDLGVEALDHFVRREEAEVPALRGISAERVIEADLMEQHHISHARVRPRVGKVVARRGDETERLRLFC